MSLDFIYNFQLKIHRALLESEKLGSQVRAIYVSTAQDGNYPCILINFLKIENKSKPIRSMYVVEFEICIFSRDKNKKSLFAISDTVSELILPSKLVFQGYNIAGIKLNNLFFNEAKDLVHNKLTMSYKAMIKKELI